MKRCCRSATRLDELAGLAAAPLEAAGQIASYLAAERDRKERAKSDAALQRGRRGPQTRP